MVIRAQDRPVVVLSCSFMNWNPRINNSNGFQLVIVSSQSNWKYKKNMSSKLLADTIYDVLKNVHIQLS